MTYAPGCQDEDISSRRRNHEELDFALRPLRTFRLLRKFAPETGLRVLYALLTIYKSDLVHISAA